MVSARQAPSRAATGSTSSAGSAGMAACDCVQKWRMPLRLSASSVSRPEPSSKAMKAQPAASTLGAPSRPESIANLPTNPENGGRPASSSVQHPKQRPRKATPAGIARP